MDIHSFSDLVDTVNDRNLNIEDYPKVQIRATASLDSKRATLVFPAEFIGETIAVVEDSYGRHRITLEPRYEGKDIVGFVDVDNVQRGKVEINLMEFNLPATVAPGKTTTWYGKQRDTDILIGQLLPNLCEQKKAPAPNALQLIQEAPRQIVIEKPMNVENAISFLNKWAEDEHASLVVEGNKLFAEVIRRWGAAASRPQIVHISNTAGHAFPDIPADTVLQLSNSTARGWCAKVYRRDDPTKPKQATDDTPNSAIAAALKKLQ